MVKRGRMNARWWQKIEKGPQQRKWWQKQRERGERSARDHGKKKKKKKKQGTPQLQCIALLPSLLPHSPDLIPHRNCNAIMLRRRRPQGVLTTAPWAWPGRTFRQGGLLDFGLVGGVSLASKDERWIAAKDTQGMEARLDCRIACLLACLSV